MTLKSSAYITFTHFVAASKSPKWFLYAVRVVININTRCNRFQKVPQMFDLGNQSTQMPLSLFLYVMQAPQPPRSDASYHCRSSIVIEATGKKEEVVFNSNKRCKAKLYELSLHPQFLNWTIQHNQTYFSSITFCTYLFIALKLMYDASVLLLLVRRNIRYVKWCIKRTTSRVLVHCFFIIYNIRRIIILLFIASYAQHYYIIII